MMTLKMTKNRTKLEWGEGRVVNGKKLCSVCREHKTIDKFGTCITSYTGYFAYCKLCTRWRQRTKNLLNKMEFILEYGGKCQCCGEKGIDFLTVEHTKGNYNGKIVDICLRGWPKEDYSVLCYNCNCSKRFGRPCSHNVEEYDKYMNMVYSYMSGEHKSRYNKLMVKLNEVK